MTTANVLPRAAAGSSKRLAIDPNFVACDGRDVLPIEVTGATKAPRPVQLPGVTRMPTVDNRAARHLQPGPASHHTAPTPRWGASTPVGTLNDRLEYLRASIFAGS